MKGGFLQSRRWIAAYLINLNDCLFALTITNKELQNNVCVVKAGFFCAHPKKTQGRQNSSKWKPKKKTQTQEKISIFRHFLGQKEKKTVR